MACVESSAFPPGPLGVYIGRLERIKGVDRLVHAVAAVNGLTLLIVGDGSERSALERLAAELGLSERVRFVGFSDRVPEYLRVADAFLLASRGEGMSNALARSDVERPCVHSDRSVRGPRSCSAMTAASSCPLMTRRPGRLPSVG